MLRDPNAYDAHLKPYKCHRHSLTDDYSVRFKGGRVYRVCRICDRERAARAKVKKGDILYKNYRIRIHKGLFTIKNPAGVKIAVGIKTLIRAKGQVTRILNGKTAK